MPDPIFKRGRTRQVIGLEVDALNVSLLCNSATTFNGEPLSTFAINGGFDGATIELSRVYAEQVGAPPVGSLVMFAAGRVAEVDITATEVRLSVKSSLELLDTPMPRNVFMSPCGRTLYAPGCNVNRASFLVAGVVSIGSTYVDLECDLAAAGGYFDLGTLTFLTGAHAGARRTVRTYATGYVQFSFPLDETLPPPQAGDTFNIVPGCDKTRATCAAKFSNLVHFRGFPYVPVPETAY